MPNVPPDGWQSEIKQADTERSDLYQEIAALLGRLPPGDVKQAISDLQNAVTDLRNLQTAVTDLQNTTTAHQAAIADLTRRVEELEANSPPTL